MGISEFGKASLLKSLAAAAATTMLYASFATAEPIVITDQRDRTITLDGEVERVVTIPIPAASVFIAVDGGTDRLVGMHQLSKTAIKGINSGARRS